MPTPRHPRHPAPHPPHRHAAHVPSPLLPQHTLPDRHAPAARHTRPLHTHLTTPYLLPSMLYFYIYTSHPPPAARPHPALSSTLHPSVQRPTPLPHALTPSSAPHSHPSILLPTPLPCTLRSPFCRKVCIPPLKQAVTHLWKSFTSKEEEHLSSTPYPADIMWITP